MPPLNSWQTIPVPPPTAPSSTGPPCAVASAAWRCRAGHVEAVDVVEQRRRRSRRRPAATSWRRPPSTDAATSASRTTPTLWVLVIAIGVVSRPDSRTHSRPVSSPLPLRRWHPAKTGSRSAAAPRGQTTVTPVRTGPWPTTSGPSPRISVVWPTVTPSTSVMALRGPGVPEADPDPEVSCSHPRRVAAARPSGRAGLAPTRPYHRPRDPRRTDQPGSPYVARPAAAACRDADRRDAPDRCGGGIPRPARPRPARECAAGTQRALDLPDGGPGGGARGAGRRSRSVRGRATPARRGWTRASSTGRTRRRSSAASSGSSATTSGTSLERLPSIAIDDQGLPPLRLGAPRLGRGMGPPDRRRPGWRPGAGRRRAAPRATPRRRPRTADDPAAARRGRPDADRAARLPIRLSRARPTRRAWRPSASTSPRRHLPGEPDAPPRDAVRRRSVGAATGGCGPATRRCSRRSSTSGRRPRRAAARAAVGLARAVPVGSIADGVVASDPIKGTRPRGRDRAEDRALALRAADERQGPRRERDDRRRAAQRPRSRLPARAPSACRGCAGWSGRRPSSTSSRP